MNFIKSLVQLGIEGQGFLHEGSSPELIKLLTGLQHGIIQIVPDALTVAKIQKEGGGIIRGTFKDEVLKKWLERKNSTASKLDDAITTFALSCAGYCVATYVLG